MSDLTQLIAATATLLGVFGSLCLQAWSLRASLRNGRMIAQVHTATNGMAARLETAAEAKGNLQGRKDERAESSNSA